MIHNLNEKKEGKNHMIYCSSMDYLRMDGKQYASKVRNKALDDSDWLSQWLE